MKLYPSDSAYRVAAMKKFQGAAAIDIDDCTAAGASDMLVAHDPPAGGAWVKAWVWVTDDEAEKEA